MGESRDRLARLALAIGGAGLLVLVAFAAAFAGLAACHPAALPGDEGWMRGYLARAALRVLAGGAATGCIDPVAAAARLGLARGLVVLAALLPVAAVLWEILGWRLWLWLMVRRGGHAVLAGPVAAVAPLAGGRPRVWLDPPGMAGGGLARVALPLAPVLQEGSGAAGRPGLGRAGLVVAATGDDLANFRLARLALAEGMAGRLVVRLEGRGLRSLAGDVLREEAGARSEVLIAAPSVVQSREALSLAMPGRFIDEAAGGAVHVALCGDGPQLEAMALAVARQGWGLQRAVPHLSILRVGGLRVGGGPPLPPDALPWVGEVLDLSFREVPQDDPAQIDAAMAAVAAGGARLSAVFCLSEAAGTASLLAGRWQRVFLDLGRAVPPLVALEPGEGGREAGLVRVAWRPDLATVGARQERLDARARAVHGHYLALMDRIGLSPLPARRPWEALAERFREDSRAAADHIGYKLGLCGMVAVPGPGPGAGLTDAEVALLAPVEHARWMAARRVAGWSLGPRDDAVLRHPDLVPFAALDAEAQAKDADQVARLPEVLAAGGETVRREWPVRAGADGLPPDRAAACLGAALARAAARGVAHVAVLRVRPGPRDLVLARAAVAAGAMVELVLADEDGAAVLTAEAVELRRMAHRLRVVADPGAAMAATPALMRDGGEEHGLAPQ